MDCNLAAYTDACGEGRTTTERENMTSIVVFGVAVASAGFWPGVAVFAAHRISLVWTK